MKIHQKELHRKVWGEEYWIVNNDKYCGKLLVLHKGYRCSLHYHEKKDETFYVNDGKVKFYMDGVIKILSPGSSVHVKPGTKHLFEGLETSSIFEFSTHHDDNDVTRITESERVSDSLEVKLKARIKNERNTKNKRS